jgi:hypothetical protein
MLDTSTVAPDTIAYVAALPAQAGDQNGLRTVIIQAANDNLMLFTAPLASTGVSLFFSVFLALTSPRSPSRVHASPCLPQLAFRVTTVCIVLKVRVTNWSHATSLFG